MFKKFVLLLLVVLGMGPAGSFADVTVWKDPDYGVLVSFPDGWMKQSLQKDEYILHLVAPAAQDKAHCIITAEKDPRFLIFPPQYMEEIVTRELGEQFWRDYLANYPRVQLKTLAQDGGLGKGFATFVDYTYETEFGPKDIRPMRGVAYATIYHDLKVSATCAADFRFYGNWYPIFAGIIQSIDFDSSFHGRSWGDYRNFFNEKILFESATSGTLQY